VPYTPPAGNAVNFNFSGAYTAPAAGSVVFNFGASPTPPSTLALPSGAAQARNWEEGWAPLPPRRIGYVPGAAVVLVPWARPTMPAALFDEPEWNPPLRRRFAPAIVASSYTARVMLFVST